MVAVFDFMRFCPISKGKADFFLKLVECVVSSSARPMTEVEKEIDGFINEGKHLSDHTGNLQFSVFPQSVVEKKMPTMLRKRLLYLSMVKLVEDTAKENAERIKRLWSDADLTAEFIAAATATAATAKSTPKRDAKGRFVKG